MYDVDHRLAQLLSEGGAFICITVVDAIGSTPGGIGSRLLVTEDGPVAGTVGGGRLEARALVEAQAMLAGAAERRFFDWSLQKDIGMTCGGRVKIYFEMYNRSLWDIRIFGAGHVAQALVRVLFTLNCRVHCYDTRPEWLARLPDNGRLVRVSSLDLSREVCGIPEHAFVLLMTMGHATDLPILEELLRDRSQAYVGVIGSRSKRAVLHRELLGRGVSEDVVENFYCPIGLRVGSNDPAEIAVSVTAQLIAERDRIADASHKSRSGPTQAQRELPGPAARSTQGSYHG